MKSKEINSKIDLKMVEYKVIEKIVPYSDITIEKVIEFNSISTLCLARSK